MTPFSVTNVNNIAARNSSKKGIILQKNLHDEDKQRFLVTDTFCSRFKAMLKANTMSPVLLRWLRCTVDNGSDAVAALVTERFFGSVDIPTNGNVVNRGAG